MSLQSICVYCGSSAGSNPNFKTTAYRFGEALAKRSLRLVYGGGSVGLMGAVADGALAAGGEVIGVIPKDLNDLELGHKGLNELLIVENMHERKKGMAEHADAFVAMPGGIGTLEELFEVYTWKQLNFHTKPCAIFNMEGYYDKLIQFLENSVDSGFLKEEHLNAVIIESDINRLIEKLLNDTHTIDTTWIQQK